MTGPREEKAIISQPRIAEASSYSNLVASPSIPAFTHNGNEPNAYYFHADHLGSTSAITDANGSLSQHVLYFAYGEPTEGSSRTPLKHKICEQTFIEEHRNSTNSPYLYNGKEYDQETGRYYYGARYYDPRISLWIGVDPLAGKYAGKSPFSYCANNPIVFIDPDGRKFINFDDKGNYKGVTKDNWFHNAFVGIKGRVLDENGSVTQKFKFADPKRDAKAIQDRIITKLVIVKEGDVRGMLSKADAFNSENKTANLSLSKRYDYILKEGVGGGKLDFSYSDIPNKYPGASKDPLNSPSPMIFLVDGVAHNHMNFGNFLFGAAGKAMGFTRMELEAGANWNSLTNSDQNKYAPQFDSFDDQYSIGRGVKYAKDQNYKKMEYKVELGPITPGVVVP
jgi:RHS repeat-associated protein